MEQYCSAEPTTVAEKNQERLVPASWKTPRTTVAFGQIKRLPINARWLPFIAVGVGAVLGGVFALYYGVDYFLHIFEGAIYGAASAGIYDVGTSVITIDHPPDEGIGMTE